mmetsp:Transcript_46217/g.98048  ORF Transcript_46217/g.98048 Transcript_46217/m.98048 type:complete len:290 (-) Transcript_46217:187-1056(-)
MLWRQVGLEADVLLAHDLVLHHPLLLALVEHEPILLASHAAIALNPLRDDVGGVHHLCPILVPPKHSLVVREGRESPGSDGGVLAQLGSARATPVSPRGGGQAVALDSERIGHIPVEGVVGHAPLVAYPSDWGVAEGSAGQEEVSVRFVVVVDIVAPRCFSRVCQRHWRRQRRRLLLSLRRSVQRVPARAELLEDRGGGVRAPGVVLPWLEDDVGLGRRRAGPLLLRNIIATVSIVAPLGVAQPAHQQHQRERRPGRPDYEQEVHAAAGIVESPVRAGNRVDVVPSKIF